MGEEITTDTFSEADYSAFKRKLSEELGELTNWFRGGIFTSPPTTVGYELEACLIDAQGRPADANEAFIEDLAMPQVVTELARFNIEFNGSPQLLAPDGLDRFYEELTDWYERASAVASTLGLRVLMIGMLPSLHEDDLALEHISQSKRYRAINRGIARLRDTDRIAMNIVGNDSYHGEFDSIMVESAATSFQLHMTLPAEQAVRWYNAAMIASGPVLAVSANSPYLFGRDLWTETRIPVFAQSVDTGKQHYVTFGSGFLKASMIEVFEENLMQFEPLLPVVRGSNAGFPHSQMHNGTIWRWNRPIIGRGNGLHLRVEHRGLPSGPSIIDMVANCAFFYGLVAALAESGVAPQDRMPFAVARGNFYQAARFGMDANLTWDGHAASASDIVSGSLIKLAMHGLVGLGVSPDSAKRWLSVIRQRVRRGLSGAGWQRAWIARHGPDMLAMTEAYAAHQVGGKPVSEWEF